MIVLHVTSDTIENLGLAREAKNSHKSVPKSHSYDTVNAGMYVHNNM